MKTIANDVKYPEFKEQYKKASWITGHLVRVEGMYYNHSKRIVTEYSYEELPDFMKESVAMYEQNLIEMDARMNDVKRNIKAHYALVEWARANFYRVSRSNQSESEYYFVRHTDGKTYEIRVSGHRHPTGSMTDMILNKIDTTDNCCAKYCDMLGIKY